MQNSQAEIPRVLKIDTTNRHTFFGLKAQGPMYEKETIENPSWEQMLNIINLMGKDEMKNIRVELFSDAQSTTLSIDYYDKENSDLDSAYGVTIEGRRCYQLFNPERKNGDQLFQVWIEGASDYGFQLEFTAVSYELTLQATKFFYDFGDIDPQMDWRTCSNLDAIEKQKTDELWAKGQRRKAQKEADEAKKVAKRQ